MIKKVDRAMKHDFGRKLLAMNVDVASTWYSQCAMDTITLEGKDKINLVIVSQNLGTMIS